MSIQLSNYILGIKEPQTIKMAKLSRELKAKGIDITDLSLGEPDFNTPAYITQAAHEAIDQGYTKYPPVAGYPDLKMAICNKLKRDNHLDYEPQQIVVSTGAKQSLANVIASLVNPGDDVLIPTPYWVTYASLVNMFGGVCQFITCSLEQHFKMTPEQLESALTENTKMIIFSSPCNPSGAVYSYEELEALKNVLVKYPHVYILSDEIYEYINFSGRHASMAEFPEMKDRTIIVNGMSKGFAMTGWRLGYLAAHPTIAAACEKFQSQITSGANTIAQRAAIKALSKKGEEITSMVQSFKERRDYFIQALSEINGFKCKVPEGAFYAFVDISNYFGQTLDGHLIRNADDFAFYLIQNVHVTGVPGEAFGDPNCIRFSFATSMSQLENAIRKMKTKFNS